MQPGYGDGGGGRCLHDATRSGRDQSSTSDDKMVVSRPGLECSSLAGPAPWLVLLAHGMMRVDPCIRTALMA